MTTIIDLWEDYVSTGKTASQALVVQSGPAEQAVRATEKVSTPSDAPLSGELREADWEALFESITDAIFVAEEPGVIIKVNQAGLELLGVDSLDEIRQHVHRLHETFELLYPDGRPVPFDDRPMSRSMRGEHYRNMACRLRNRRGKETELLVSGGPVKPVPGMPRRYLQVSRDVTEVRRLERAKEQFMQVVGHELRNPLTSIRGFVDLLEARLLPQAKDDRISKYVRLMRAEVERLAQLVNDLSTAYRVSSGRLALSFKPAEFGSVLAEAAAPYEVNPAGREVDVAPLTEPATVNGDHRRLVEVLTNLLSNAVKYTRPGGHVWVTAATVGDAVVAQVEDDGIGIPQNQLEQVFEGFHRVRNLTEHDPGGLGLGLFISRDIARRHGGDLWAENRPGGGTVMKLRLPLLK